MANGSVKTPWRRSRALGGLPKLGVAGSNPVRRSLEANGIADPLRHRRLGCALRRPLRYKGAWRRCRL
jgi:hypothetical protein